MITEVILHIGMHKTGSSSIQASLLGFSSDGLHYADLGRPNHSRAMTTMFMSDVHRRRKFVLQGLGKKQVRGLAAKFKSKLERQLQERSGTLVISGETMTRLSYTDVHKLKEYFAAKGIKVRVLAYARAPESYAVSYLQEVIVKSGARKAVLSVPNYRKSFEPFFDAFGDDSIEIRKFEPSTFTNNSVVTDFNEWCGIPTELVKERRANMRSSKAAVGIIFYFNNHGPLSTGAMFAYNARKRFIADVLSVFDGEPFSLPKGTYQYDKATIEDLAWLKSRVGLDLVEPEANLVSDGEQLDVSSYLLEIAQEQEQAVREHLKSVGVKVSSKSGLKDLLTYWYYLNIRNGAVSDN